MATVDGKIASYAGRIGPNPWIHHFAYNIRRVPGWFTFMTVFMTWPYAWAYANKKGYWHV